MDTKTYNEINNILADWDPIGVGLPISKDEYKGYIPKIYNTYRKNIDLKNVLLSILQDDLSLSINPNDSELNEDLENLIVNLKEQMNDSR